MKLNLRTHLRLLAAVATITVSLLAVIATANVMAANNSKTSQVAFHDAMRKLWEDHITWTRLVIISLVNNLPDSNTTVTRLLQNQQDIGNAVKPFYGNAAGDKLASLLHDHITIAAEILVDAKAGDTAKLNDALARWYTNANDIAAFLHSANPKHWSLAALQSMMKTHLDLTLQEATTYLKGDYSGSVSAYEQVHLEILHMADVLSSGIIQQFPQMFGGPAVATVNMDM